MSAQPVFEAQYVEQRSRVTTFFRLILAIPHFVVAMVWGIAAFFAIVAAWFAVVITGRYPDGLYGFIGSFNRYLTAVYGYTGLLTDEYPPFSGDTDGYPVHLVLPPAKTEYSRAKAFFRLILAIPVYIIAYAMQIVWEVGALIAWFVILVLGKQPKGLQDMIVLGLSYQQRAAIYYCLMTEDWPPFTDPPRSQLDGGPSGDLPPVPAATTAPGAVSESSGLTSGDPLSGS